MLWALLESARKHIPNQLREASNNHNISRSISGFYYRRSNRAGIVGIAGIARYIFFLLCNIIRLDAVQNFHTVVLHLVYRDFLIGLGLQFPIGLGLHV